MEKHKREDKRADLRVLGNQELDGFNESSIVIYCWVGKDNISRIEIRSNDEAEDIKDKIKVLNMALDDIYLFTDTINYSLDFLNAVQSQNTK